MRPVILWRRVSTREPESTLGRDLLQSRSTGPGFLSSENSKTGALPWQPPVYYSGLLKLKISKHVAVEG